MSVTIVSALSKPAQATTTENPARSPSTDDNSAVSSFSSLLRGQLAPAAKNNTAAQADSTVEESIPSDAAALLAALGLIAGKSGNNSETTEVEDTSHPGFSKEDKSDANISDSVQNVLQATAAIGQNLGETKVEGASLREVGKIDVTTSESTLTARGTAEFVEQNSKESVMTNSVLSETAAVDDRPAKFAALTAAAQNTENISSKTVSADTIPSSMAVPAGNLHTAPIRHDVSLSVPTSIRDQSWASDFGQKIVWLAGNDKQSAQITLNPPQMGPIEVSLSLDKGSASASFTSANSEVRNALETAMPKLREMFASAGIELGQTNVSAESFRQQAENGNANGGSSQWRSDNAILVADSAISPSARTFGGQRGNGLVDIFA